MAHANEELMATGYKAFETGDLDTLTKMWAEDVVVHVLGTGRLAGDVEGRDAVFALFGELATISNGTFRLEVHDLLANDVHGVALVSSRAERDGRSYEAQEVHVYHVSDGQVTEAWFFDSDQAAAADFFD